MTNESLYTVIVRSGNTAKIFKGRTAQETTQLMGEYKARLNCEVLAVVSDVEVYDKEGVKDIDE